MTFEKHTPTHLLSARKYCSALIFHLLVITVACQNNKQGTPDETPASMPAAIHLTDMTIDSFKTYPLDNQLISYDQGFLFSPFERNKVWVVTKSNESFEIDLESGRKTFLSEKFQHNFFKRPLSLREILPDPFDQNVCWFLNFDEGICRYDRFSILNRPLEFFIPGIKPVTAVFSSTHVWIGTKQGLWVYDRKKGNCQSVDYSPGSISYMRIMEDGKLFVKSNDYYDHDFTYNPESNCWENYPKQYTVGISSSDSDLPMYGGAYKTASTTSEFWSCNSYYWFSKRISDNTVFYLHPPALTADLLSIMVDSDHLYVLYEDRFLVADKQYLFKHRAGDPALLSKIKHLQSLTDSLNLHYHDDWTDHKAKMGFLNSVFASEADPYIRMKLNEYAEHVALPKDEKSVRALLFDSSNDTRLRYRVYRELNRKYIRDGKLRKALTLESEVKKKWPQADFLSPRDTAMLIVEGALQQLDSIDRRRRPEDEQLWARNIVMKEFCIRHPFFGDRYCHEYSLSDSILRRLVRLYPDSPRAEDADYNLIIQSLCYACDDGINRPEEVKKWQEFLQKYPKSRNKAGILCSMAWALGREEADIRKGIKWLEEAEHLKPGLFVKDSMDSNMFWVKKYFQERLDDFDLVPDIQLKKDRVRMYEPVEIVFSLKNKSNVTKKLLLQYGPETPNFHVEIKPLELEETCMRPMTYIESSTPLKQFYNEQFIKPGKAYTESWDLTKTVCRLHARKPGRFVFDRTGTYTITAYLNSPSNSWMAEATLIVE